MTKILLSLVCLSILCAFAPARYRDGKIDLGAYYRSNGEIIWDCEITTAAVIDQSWTPIGVTDFEIMVSTTFSFGSCEAYKQMLEKNVIKEKYFQEWKTKKDLEDAQAANTDLDLSADIDKADKKLKEIKAAHSKAQ